MPYEDKLRYMEKTQIILDRPLSICYPHIKAKDFWGVIL